MARNEPVADAKSGPADKPDNRGLRLVPDSIQPDPRTEDLAIKYLFCRESGHHFPRMRAQRERIRDYDLSRRSGEQHGPDYTRDTRTCQTCGSSRIDLVDASRTRRLATRRYDYAEGYLAAGGRISREHVRLELEMREGEPETAADEVPPGQARQAA